MPDADVAFPPQNPQSQPDYAFPSTPEQRQSKTQANERLKGATPGLVAKETAKGMAEGAVGGAESAISSGPTGLVISPLSAVVGGTLDATVRGVRAAKTGKRGPPINWMSGVKP